MWYSHWLSTSKDCYLSISLYITICNLHVWIVWKYNYLLTHPLTHISQLFISLFMLSSQMSSRPLYVMISLVSMFQPRITNSMAWLWAPSLNLGNACQIATGWVHFTDDRGIARVSPLSQISKSPLISEWLGISVSGVVIVVYVRKMKQSLIKTIYIRKKIVSALFYSSYM